MPFKKMVRELRGRNKAVGRSHIAPEGSSSSSSSPSTEQSIWVDLPPELLLDIIHRIESGQSLWPGRRDVVACASVCRSWREMTKDEVVKAPQLSGLLTFPVSLTQPGPRDAPIQCFIKRERATGIYRLYLGLSPALSGDKSKLLLSAKKVRRATGMEFVVSLSGNDFSRSSTSYIGKLRSNFLGTKFTVYEIQPPPVYSERSSNRKLPPSMRVSPWVSSSTQSYNMASILYELNVLRTRGPRRMQCIMNSIPNKKKSMMDFCTGNMGGESVVKEPLVLKNKSPRWHEQLQCWCLNFKGRVTVASVKNFQLIAAAAEAGKNMNIPEEEQERVILQFGKIGKDIFTMDYHYPISAFQAFAICLSSFDTKPMKAFVRGLIARANLEMPKIQRKWAWKESAGFGGVTPPPPPPEKGLENLTVADVLLTKDTDGGGGGKVDTLISCRTNDTVFDAVKNMAKHNIGSLVVLRPGDQQYIAGIVTERDYMKKIIGAGRSSKVTKVGEVMTDESKLVSVSSGTNIIKAMQLMSENHIRHVPVIDGKIVGMISMVDVVRAIVDHQNGELKRLNQFIKGDYY
uniref:CBS domain-containing protein n=1 Tax=Brassica oleracea TaxID=3712 RepID=A0A3P6FNV9_BRAOL|nr:unnamed protein product [Brassica oleracea]